MIYSLNLQIVKMVAKNLLSVCLHVIIPVFSSIFNALSQLKSISFVFTVLIILSEEITKGLNEALIEYTALCYLIQEKVFYSPYKGTQLF